MIVHHGLIIRHGLVRAAKVADAKEHITAWLAKSVTRVIDEPHAFEIDDGLFEIKSPEEYLRILYALENAPA